MDANLVLRNKVGKYGILKAYGNFTWSTSLMNYYDIDTPTEKAAMQLDNLYGYFNTSYKDIIGQRWSYIIGASFSSSKDTYSFEPDIVNEHNSGGQFKATFSGEVNRYIDITAGVDFFQRNHSFLYQGKSDDSQSKLGFGEQIMATFVEADINDVVDKALDLSNGEIVILEDNTGDEYECEL